MKILVAVKRVIDYNVQVRVKEDNTGVVTENVKMSTNPPDDNAIEEAVKIKEVGKATEVIAVSIGEEKAQETVRKALAVGADRGILVKTEGILEPLAVSKLLQKVHPDYTKVVKRYRRWHHQVDYSSFTQKLIRKEKLVKIRGNMVEKGFIAPICIGKFIIGMSDT